jgi:hypothetical protein
MKITRIGKPAQEFYTNETIKEITCPCCESELEYDKDDLESDYLSTGKYYIVCPVCKFKVEAEKITPITATYPEDFYFFDHGADIDERRKQVMIDECVDWLRNYPDENYSYSASGNTFVIAYRTEEDVEVTVATKYANATIPDFYWKGNEI